LIVRLAHRIDREIIDTGENLEVISTATTGLNHIDTDYAKEKKIDILSLKGETKFLEDIHATAEHTWALILALIRKVPQSFQSVKKGEWDRDSFKGRELHGATLGIVGFGRIGKKIAKYGQAFGMEVIAYTKDTIEQVDGVSLVDSLSTLLEKSDIVSIHVPLNSTTRMMFRDKEFNIMKKGSILINTSRGEIIDEDALMNAIKYGFLAGAALDVLEDEVALIRKRKSKIIEFAKNEDRIIITPHIGGATIESMEKTEIFMADKLVNYFETKSSMKYQQGVNK
jgi:D-3-phosphoglycerate dehydrogenase